MNYYFNFSNEEKSRYIKADKLGNIVKTNLENFSLKIFAGNSLDYKNITKYKLVVEKEQNGSYYFYKEIEGRYDSSVNEISFSKDTLESQGISNSRFRLYLECYEGGIKVFDGKNDCVFVLLRLSCPDYKIDIKNAVKISNIYEMAEENPIVLNLVIEVGQNEYNALTYTCAVSHLEDYKHENYISQQFSKPLTEVNLPIIDGMFKNNNTYFHVKVIDSFGNFLEKKIKIVLKNSEFFGMEIKDEVFKITSLEDTIYVNFEKRMVNYVKPFLVNKENEVITSNNLVNLNRENNGVIQMKISDFFQRIFDEDFGITFQLNDSESFSNIVPIINDNKGPVVSFSNFDENNYFLDSKDGETVISGVISDSNYFYIGNNKQLDFKEVKKYLITSDQRAKFISVNGEIFSLKTLGTNKYCEVSDGFSILDSNKVELTDVEYVTDLTKQGNKKCFITIPKSRLDFYELNIIENQNGLTIKGDLSGVIENVKCDSFEEFFLLSFEVPASNTDIYSFDIGIRDFDYSFLRRVGNENCSFELNGLKEASLDFETTGIVLCNTSKPSVFHKFNNAKRVSFKNTVSVDNFSTLFISIKNDESFSTENSFSYIDDSLNAKETKQLFQKPVFENSEGVFNYKAITMEKVSDDTYHFSVTFDFVKKINELTFTISDELTNSFRTGLIIEKNTDSITSKINDSRSIDIIANGNEVVSNKEQASFIIEVLNETLKNKQGEAFVSVKSSRFTKKSKIIDENGKRNAYFTITNIEDLEEFEILYNETLNIGNFNIRKQEFLKLVAEEEIISGNSFYFMELQKDKFADLKIEHDNVENFSITYNEEKEHIVINRIKNSTFIEKMTIKLTVSDKTGKIKPSTKTVKCIFYNEAVIYSYEIKSDFMHNNKLVKPKFDLVIKSIYSSDIKGLYIYDKNEYDISKRRKYAEFNNGEFLIKGIVSPAKTSDLDLFIIVEEGIEIKKTLFNNYGIEYSPIEDKLEVSYYQDEENLTLEIKNNINEVKKYKLNFVINSNSVFSIDDNFGKYEVKRYKISKENYKGNCVAYLEFENEIGVVKKTGYENISLSKQAIYARISELKQTFIYFSSKPVDLKLLSNAKISNLDVSVINEDGTVISKCDISNYEIKLPILQPGNYYIEIRYSDINSNKILTRYAFTYSDSISDYIEVNKFSFEKINEVSTVFIKNTSLVQTKELNSKIYHYCDGVYVGIFYPEIMHQNALFELRKEVGTNTYIYEDNYVRSEIASYTKVLKESVAKLANIRTQSEPIKDEKLKNADKKIEVNKQIIFVPFKNKLYNVSKVVVSASHKPNHRLYQYSNNIAKASCEKEWLELCKEEKNKILKKFEFDFYKKEKFSIDYESNLKRELLIYIGGNQWKK